MSQNNGNMSRVCRFFAETGTCRFGENCRYSHDVEVENYAYATKEPDHRASRRNQGDDTRLVCRNFSETGQCRFGDNCRFSHDVNPTQNTNRSQTRDGNRYNSSNNASQNTNRSTYRNDNHPRDDLYNYMPNDYRHEREIPFSFTNQAKPFLQTSTPRSTSVQNFSFINPPKIQSVFQRGTFAINAPSVEVEEVECEVNLTREEILQFENSDFEIGNIPLNAPPPKFCE
eukprot:NODE_6_length_48303_cov_0.387022.p16 type:complete len:229 gc:universal NODE_6_length_48303_cov_0.387022:25251-24565(-)